MEEDTKKRKEKRRLKGQSFGPAHERAVAAVLGAAEMSATGCISNDFLNDKNTVQLLDSYCMSLPQREINEKNTPIYEFLETNAQGCMKFQCAILMPKIIPAHLRCAIGPIVNNKAEAKRLVCGQMLGNIYQYELNMAEKIADGENVSEYHRFLAKSGLSTVHLKVVPDKLITRERNTNLFLYAIRAMPDSKSSRFCTFSCIGCCEHLKSLNQVGLALVSPLSRDVLDTSQKFSLRSTESIDVNFVFLGEYLYSDEVVHQMQRFHKAISCWENECGEIKSDAILENSIMCHSPCKDHCICDAQCHFAAKIPKYSHLFGLPSGKSGFIPLNEWGSSSNGSCYIFFPLPESVCTLPLSAADLAIKPSEFGLFADESSLLMHLVKCADEAQTLVYNLRIQKKMNDSPSLIYYAPTNDQLKPNDLAGQIISRGSGDLFMGLHHQYRQQVKLTDIMKVKATTPKSNRPIHLKNGEDGDDSHFSKRPRIDGENTVADKAVSDIVSSVSMNLESEKTRVTYGDNFVSKNPTWRCSIEKLQTLDSHYLVSVMPIVSKLTVVPIAGPLTDTTGTETLVPQQVTDQYNLTVAQSLGQIFDDGVGGSINNVSRYHNHSVTMHLLPESCHPLGKAKWFYFGLVAPCVAWRVQTILLGNECVEKIINCAETYNSTVFSDPIDIQRFVSISPHSLDMLRAITFRCAGESFDNERLESLGDSILKLVTTVKLYQKYTSSNENELTKLRQDLINNATLSQKSRCLDLSKYMHAVNLSSGKQALQIRPPGMEPPNMASDDTTLSIWNSDIVSKRYHQTIQIESKRKNSKKTSAESMAVEGDVVNEVSVANIAKVDVGKNYFKFLYPRPQMLTAVVQDKLKADFVEALIGAYYLSGGLEASIDVIKLLGLLSQGGETGSATTDKTELFIPDGYPDNLLRRISSKTIVNNKSKVYSDKYYGEHNNYTEKFRGNCVSPTHTDEDLIISINSALGYRFKSIELLHQALTHDTIVKDVRSNQRLEFLGDAVLDFIVCSAIFRNCPSALCGDISLGKCILTNNKMLAKFSYKSRMFRHLRIGSRSLFDQFLRISNEFASTGKSLMVSIIKINEDLYKGKEQINTFQAEEDKLEQFLGDTSKPLADMFEAMIGAIYLDSNFDLRQVENMLKHIEAIEI